MIFFKNKNILKSFGLISSCLIVSPLLVSCSNQVNSDDATTNSPSIHSDQELINIFKTNFNNQINDNNFIDKFSNVKIAKNTISELFNYEISNNEINNLEISNASSKNDKTLILNFLIEYGNNKLSFSLFSNLINPNSDMNLSYFIFDNNNLMGINEQGKQQTTLIFPSKIKSICLPNNYFNNNHKIKTINLTYCNQLVEITNSIFSNAQNIENILFNNCKNLLNLPNGLFMNNVYVKNISFKNCISIKKIPDDCFNNCSSLTNVNFNNCLHLQSLGINCLNNCSSISSLDFSSTYKYWSFIDNNAFSNMNNLTFINLKNIMFINFGDNVFLNSPNIKQININSPKSFAALRWSYKQTNSNFEDVILINQDIEPNYTNLSKTINNIVYNENAFLENAIKVANDDSILWYNVNWIATLHKYGSIAHLLKVLELNPNKEIHLILSDYIYKANKFDFSFLTNKYKNIKLKISNTKPSEYDSNNFLFSLCDEFINEVDKTKNNVLYTADFNFIYNFKTEMNINNVSNQMKDNLVKTYFKVMQAFKEINMLGDGTAIAYFYQNNAYDSLFNDYFSFNQESFTYDNLIKIQTDCLKMNDLEFRSWLDKDLYNPYLFMFSLPCASKSLNDNKIIPKVNFYVTYCNMIKDINNTTSSLLNENINFNQYFDPYNSLGMNFIGFMNSFNQEALNMFCNIIKSPLLNKHDFEVKFKNSYNVIYGGNKMNNDHNIINSQAIRLIKIAKLNQNKTNNKKLKVWFKGNPSDTDDYWDLLMDEITNLVNNNSSITNKKDFLNYFDCLIKEIPIEVYLASGVFNNNINHNYEIKMYATYSTYVLSIFANNMSNIIEKIIVINYNKNQIYEFFGKNSFSFPESLLITEEELFS